MGVQIGLKPDDVFSSTDTAAGKMFGLNDVVEIHDGRRYRFGQSTDTIAQYDVCAVTTAGIASRITKALADTGPYVGVAQATISSGSYGWFQIYGVTSVNVLSTCSSSVALYTSATAGSVDDTSTSQDKIAGLVLLANATVPAATAAFLAAEPFVAL